MSVIAAVIKNGRVSIACDLMVTQDTIKVKPNNLKNGSKFIRFKDNYIGFVGWSTVQIVFEHILETHKRELNFSSRWDIFESSMKIHRLLKKEYFFEVHDEEEDSPVESSSISCLIINKNGIFELDNYRDVSEYTRFWAIGSGRRLALGAMNTAFDLLDDAKVIAKKGVEASCEFENTCGLPIESGSFSIVDKMIKKQSVAKKISTKKE